MRTDTKAPTAFLSYSWDSASHRKWARLLASRLREDGVDVTLDYWHVQPGDQVAKFMESAVRENDFVLIVCTPRYRERSNGRLGGVGYEGNVMTGEVLNTGNERKFIPLLRSGEWTESAPSWLSGKVAVDLRGDPYSEERYRDLLQTLHGAREAPPPVGTRPQFDKPVVRTNPAVIFDEAHLQKRWALRPCLDFGYSAAGQTIARFATIGPNQEAFSKDTLQDSDVLILPIPYGTLVAQNEYESVVSWLHGGGGLLICGFYFMESHLYTNLNKLAFLLHFRFRTDLIMPLGKESRDDILGQAFTAEQSLCVFTFPHSENEHHPLLLGVRRIALQSSCSLETYLPPPELQLKTDATVSVVNPKGPPDPGGSGHIIQIQRYDIHRGAETFLIAFRVGKGRVVAVGSWKIFQNEYVEDETVDNRTLLNNAVRWLLPERWRAKPRDSANS